MRDLKVTFEEWYEKNKETLSVVSNVEALKRAWEAGVASEKQKIINGFFRGMHIGMRNR